MTWTAWRRYPRCHWRQVAERGSFSEAWKALLIEIRVDCRSGESIVLLTGQHPNGESVVKRGK